MRAGKNNKIWVGYGIAFIFVQIGKLSVFFYDIFLWLYGVGIRIASLWNVKARQWVRGRKKIFSDIRSSIHDTGAKLVWIHCSSLGEFEQGRPLIEKLKTQYPNCKILITFFSPSGYEVRRNYGGVEYVFYLPMDSGRNARIFLDLINPSLVIFIKYDYWYHYLNEIKRRKISCLLVSAVFRKDQSFFKWYGSLQRKMLRCFTRIFVQNEKSKTLLENVGITEAIVAGDTRFDTVIDNAENFKPIPVVEKFIGHGTCIVAGSTWDEDEEYLQQALPALKDSTLKLIIAPHEIDEGHLDKLKHLFPSSTRFSELSREANLSNADVLIIDNIGLLSRLYRYSYLAYIGGGFTRDGVHNVLEAAVYGKPVVFGENYKKYKEAVDLVDQGGAKSFADAKELQRWLNILFANEREYTQSCQASKNYVEQNRGATRKIIDYIEEKRLLTS